MSDTEPNAPIHRDRAKPPTPEEIVDKGASTGEGGAKGEADSGKLTPEKATVLVAMANRLHTQLENIESRANRMTLAIVASLLGAPLAIMDKVSEWPNAKIWVAIVL